MWLAAVDPVIPPLVGAVAAFIVAVGGILIPFLVPIATKRTKDLEEKLVELERKVAECEQDRETERREMYEWLGRQLNAPPRPLRRRRAGS